MASPRRAVAAGLAATLRGGGEKSVGAADVSEMKKKATVGRKGLSLPTPPNNGIQGVKSTSPASEGGIEMATARRTAAEAAECANSPDLFSKSFVALRDRGVSTARTRSIVASRLSLCKSVKFGSPTSDCHAAGGPFGGVAVTTARGSLKQAAAARAHGGRNGEHTLMFASRLVLRHGEYWNVRPSARREAEVPPEVLCAQYSALEHTLFVGLSTGVLLVWRNPFAAGAAQPEVASLVIKAREHTGALSALTYHRKLEADRTPHHFQALQQLQRTQGILPSSKNWETLPSWSTGSGKQHKQQQQQASTAAAAADQGMSATASRPTGVLLHARELGVRDAEDHSGVLFTGSADRCVKVWFIHEKKVVCIKTLCYHGGTIVAIAYCSPLLFSSSTDGTVLICRVGTAASTLKHPQFTPVQRIFVHQSYHPSTKLVLSNKKVWYDSLAATRKDGDTIYLYCGATDGTILALDNSQVLVPSNPIIGGGGAPPMFLRTQERAASTAVLPKKIFANKDPNTAPRSSTHNAPSRYSASEVCDPSNWKELLDNSSHGCGSDENHDHSALLLLAPAEKSTAPAVGALVASMEAMSAGAVLPVPFRILKQFHVHSLGVRHLLCLPLDSVVASLGSEASVAVIDPLTAQVWWQNANPEGYCYSAFTWMPAFNLLLVGDEGGNLSFYNVYSRERVYSQQVTSSKIVTLEPGGSKVFAYSSLHA